MRRHLTLDDLDGLLEEPLIAVIGTYRKDGEVLLAPVWHEWRDGAFSVITPLAGIKGRHVTRDPRASIVVYEQTSPFRGVEASCTVTVDTDDVHEHHVRIATRYLGPDAGREFADRKAAGQVRLRLTPVRFRAWDYRGEL
ncbi:PPOX class probable F420-dependent enzyme [Nocardioides thalensis]|uniref:PPOX class probable F420-dependent enzyme n=1 Tax=Nocardioides thalensis TaxID=1914755 RepID=A0A853C7T2_9ACTN|nr:PPOX class probable F420-dependent enzyme [Nocardioides thalensis]